MSAYRPGGEVDAFCTRCKMVLAHTIVAVWAEQIRRVRCNTCMGEHAYHAAAPQGEPRPSRARASSPSTRAEAPAAPQSYLELLQGKDRKSARRYSVREKLEVGDLVEHPSFGLGIVAAARGLDKVEVAFPTSVRTLLHNRGAAPAFLVKPLVPKRPDVELDDSTDPDPAADTSDE